MEKIHLASHSRGTDVLMTALRELIIEYRATGVDLRRRLKVDNVLLLAADIDLEAAVSSDILALLRFGDAPGQGRRAELEHLGGGFLANYRCLFGPRDRVSLALGSDAVPVVTASCGERLR